MTSNRKAFILLLILPVLVLSISGCTSSQEEDGTRPEQQEQQKTQPPLTNTPEPPLKNSTALPQQGAPGGGITVSLSFPNGAPLLNQKVELICTLSSKIDLPDSTVQIILPKGATLVKGNLECQKDLKAGAPTSFSTQIMFEEIGKWSIEVSAKNVVIPPSYWWGMDIIYLTVWADHSEFGWPPTGPVPIEQ